MCGRTPPTAEEQKLSDYGRIRFGGNDADREPARFLHLSDTPNALWMSGTHKSRESLEAYVEHVIDMMELYWDLQVTEST